MSSSVASGSTSSRKRERASTVEDELVAVNKKRRAVPPLVGHATESQTLSNMEANRKIRWDETVQGATNSLSSPHASNVGSDPYDEPIENEAVGDHISKL